MNNILKSALFLLSIYTLAQCYDKKTILSEINSLAGNEYKNGHKILNIIEKQDICAVFIKPPFREFPNIILFKQTNGNWQRIKEGFTIGITDKQSDILDLHTKGLASDFKIQGVGKNDMNSNDVKKIIEFGIKQNKGTLSIYSDFIHMHTIESANGFCLLDKTNYESIAKKLFGEELWNKYPNDNCSMYDLPDIVKTTMEYNNGKYIIKCQTSNKQQWNISFSNSDSLNIYLLNKEIEVK